MKRNLIIIASAHIIFLLGLVIVPSCQKKPKVIKPDIPINITEETMVADKPKQEPEKKLPIPKEEVKPEPKPEPKEEAKPEPEPKKAPEPKKEIKKETPKPKPKKVKKKKIIKKEPTKSLKEKLKEKLKQIDKKTETKEAPTSSTAVKKTDLRAKNFPFKWYLSIVQQKVKTNWQEPGKVPGMSDSINAAVSFTINKEGAVSNITITKSSSFVALDNSVLKAVKNSQPFPPLPENYNKDSLEIVITFNLSS